MMIERIADCRSTRRVEWEHQQMVKAQAISPDILLHLNVSVFRQLRKLGTSKPRVCAVLNLTADEYDYVDSIA